MFDKNGQRKYINRAELRKVLLKLPEFKNHESLFCEILIDTGCRISEAISLRTTQIDLNNKCIIFETLKKRKKGIYRSVPISAQLTRKVLRYCDLRKENVSSDSTLWTWSRVTAYRLIKEVMARANIHGPHANPRGLRHGFAIAALESGVPITLVQRWLGHASLKTTAIYTQVVGEEERRLAARMWRHSRGTAVAHTPEKNS